MFCYQCQETAKGTGCTVRGICGKTDSTANLQDLLIHTTRIISEIVIKENIDITTIRKINEEVIKSLFMTITNANFSDDAIIAQITKNYSYIDTLKSNYNINISDRESITLFSKENMLMKSKDIGVLRTKDEDKRSLKELILYGLKGYAAYTNHAMNLDFYDNDLFSFTYEALYATLKDDLSIDELMDMVLKTGEYGVKVMALLDKANTSSYGVPEATKVNIGVRNNPAILISGHDLKDLEMLLEQTKGTGVDVYTHSEMLPAHSYPFFKKYDNLVGNYGNAWWQQKKEFKTFNGPILFTTNCIVPTKEERVVKRIFTTGASGLDGSIHIEEDENGYKDFSPIIEMAKTLPAPEEIETGTVNGGYAHSQVTALSDKIVEAVKSGDIKKFFVMGGCDGRMSSRTYYTEFAKRLPDDTIILTSGCAKYRYNKLPLANINGIPRVLDAGQCNDSYSVAMVALKLKELFGLDDINELPIVYNIAWYEQKAIIVLLALLYLGIKNIQAGPTLPGFFSPNVANVLVEKFGISSIGEVDEDIRKFTS